MQKGKFGVSLNVYAIIAFVLALLNQTVLGGLLLFFVLVYEKDEWTTRQCMQAFFLSLLYKLFIVVVAVLYGINYFLSYIYFMFGNIFSVLSGAILVAGAITLLVFNILGIVRAAKAEEAALPWLNTLAYKAFGKTVPQEPTPPANGEQ